MNEPVEFNCGDTTTESCIHWGPGPIAYFDKVVGIIFRDLHNTVLNLDGTSPQIVWDTSNMRFYGECAPNTDIYTQFTFDGMSGISLRPQKLHASSSTTNYLVTFASRAHGTETPSIVIHKIIYDPDPNACSTQGMRTPPKVTVHKPQYLDGGFLSQQIGYQLVSYSKINNAFICLGTHDAFPSIPGPQTPVNPFGSLFPIKLEDIDDMILLPVTNITSGFRMSRYTIFSSVNDATVVEELTMTRMYQVLDVTTYFTPIRN